jgi:hypothetical protein
VSNRLSRFAPLMGLVFGALFAAVTLTEKETPEACWADARRRLVQAPAESDPQP